MSRVMLVHWNAAEARERAARLQAAGYQPEVFSNQNSGATLRTWRENPPAAFVIDLSRLPSHGRAVGTALRQQRGTRHVPLVFVGGDLEKVAVVRRLLPDAVSTEWSRIRSALREALRNAPANPVVPGTMAGYSGTPLAKKLGIRAGSVVALLGAPDGLERKLDGLPENVQLEDQLRGRPDVILLFVSSQADLGRRFSSAARALANGGGLWIIWPKKASGVATDLTQADVRAYGLAAGFVDYKICAVDETWSGLLFARRKPK